ncbi:MAG: MarR family transcriptional regulator [Thermoleophilia bacterium]
MPSIYFSFPSQSDISETSLSSSPLKVVGRQITNDSLIKKLAFYIIPFGNIPSGNKRGNTLAWNKQNVNDLSIDFILYLIELIDRVRTPSIEMMADFERRLRPIFGDDDPQDIAGGINFFHFSEILHRMGNPTMGDLSSHLSMPHATMTRLVDWWVGKGLAERLADPSDRRVIRVTLTDSGGKFHEVLRELATKQAKNILGSLTDKEQATFIDLLKKLTS